MFTRKSVWSAGGDLSDPTLLWYAKGVGILKQRPITDPTSWTFLAAIHGFDNNLWLELGYLDPASPLPSSSMQTSYWHQCQHQSWYFLPWHRGYILSLEANVRAAIIEAGGPANWALPYWNYSDQNNPQARDLPPAFSRQTLPDGTPNPLYIEQRYGQQKNTLPLPTQDVALSALHSTFFTGSNTGGNPGFGGPITQFSHSGNASGNLEQLPHNIVHVDIGNYLNNGVRATDLGLMTNPDTAALDPTFYLHHANIDRLWEVWLNRSVANQNPSDSSWLNGPVDRGFIVPMADGQGWQYTAKDVVSTETLGYNYDDTQDPFSGESALATRLERLGSSSTSSPSFSISGSDKPMDNKQRTELIGANSSKIQLLGSSASTQVQLDKPMVQQTNISFAILETNDTNVQEPDRIYLNLENIRSDVDGQVIDIYVNLPSDADPAEHSDLHVGSIAFFGVRKASLSDQPHGGLGVTQVFDITHIVDALHLEGSLNDLASLDVHLQPRSVLTQAHNVTVERISIYREGN